MPSYWVATNVGPMTLNNYTDEELEHLRNAISDQRLAYITWIKEVGESGTPHLQIYARGSRNLTMGVWKQILGDRVANIVKTDEPESARKYCQGWKWNVLKAVYEQKPGSDLSSVEEYGKHNSQGKRTDIEKCRDFIMQNGLKAAVKTSHVSAVAKYHGFFEVLDRQFTREAIYDGAKEQHMKFLETYEHQPWTKKLMSIVEEHDKETIDARTIYWFYDHVGESGKTAMGKYLKFEKNAFYCTGGKASDIFFAYECQDMVVFNLPASKNKENWNYLYEVIETLKDGICFSGKYKAECKVFKPPTIIVFANESPDVNIMKRNRLVSYDIQELNRTGEFFVPATKKRFRHYSDDLQIEENKRQQQEHQEN